MKPTAGPAIAQEAADVGVSRSVGIIQVLAVMPGKAGQGLFFGEIVQSGESEYPAGTLVLVGRVADRVVADAVVELGGREPVVGLDHVQHIAERHQLSLPEV